MKLGWHDPQAYTDIHRKLLLFCRGRFNSSQKQILFVKFRPLPTQSYALLKGFTPRATEVQSYLAYRFATYSADLQN